MELDRVWPWAEQLSTGLVLADARLRVVWLNPSLAGLVGLGPRSLAGQPLARLLPLPALPEQADRARARGGTVQWRDIALDAADGRRLRADVALQAWDEGHFLAEVHRVAEVPPAASPLSATLRGFAHEVKNPLAGLRGAAQLLQRRVADPELKALASLVIGEADRLAALAGRLLQSGGAHPVSLNIHAVLERLERLLAAEPAPLRIEHDFDPSIPDLVGDPDRLLQALLNLARNAAEAGARTLRLRTRIDHAGWPGEHGVRAALRVDVTDDGPGVPAALCDTLFEPMVSGRADGSGLGLALAREIAREHGGDLRLAMPRPSTFALLLPLPRSEAVAGVGHATSEGARP